MDYRYKQLEQDLSALTSVFSELGSRLSDAVKDVTVNGAPPSEKLIEQILTARTKFDTVRSAVHTQAGAMLVSPLPKPTDLISVQAINALLKIAAHAEESKSSAEGEREKVSAILSRVLAIAHRDGTAFQPLQECHTKIVELRTAVSKVVWPNRHPEADAILGAKHPSIALLNFIENHDTLEDEKWMALETLITEAYGKPLFVAASRGKLIASASAPAAKAPEPAKPAPVAEKKPAPPVEKPVTTTPAPAASAPVEKPAAPAPAPPVQVAPPAVSIPTPPAPAVAHTPAAPVAAAPPAVPAVTPITATTLPPRPPSPATTISGTPAQTPPAASSLSALANATETPAEKRPAAAAPAEHSEKSRKEPRLAVPPQPQQVAKPEPTPAPEAAEEITDDDANKAIAGDGSQRPQRWGFWRGNR